MIQEVKVPSQGESIVSGILSRWCVANGDSVSKGQILYELETDKITFEGLADVAGRIELTVAEGAEVEIGQVIARVDTAVTAPAKEETTHSRRQKQIAAVLSLIRSPFRCRDQSGTRDPEASSGLAKPLTWPGSFLSRRRSLTGTARRFPQAPSCGCICWSLSIP